MTIPRQPAAPGGKITGNPWIRWHPNPNNCPHFNDDICPTCDHDGYYAATYPDCPWRETPTNPAVTTSQPQQ